jgi:Rap1a immunity proteins
MKFPLLLCLALALPECLAQPAAAPQHYSMNGDQFVKMMKGPVSFPMDPYDYMQREKAYSYLDGARDTAEGRVWCDVDQLKTPDLAYEMAELIAKLPTAERKKNASLLLLEQLKRTYPCRRAGGKS